METSGQYKSRAIGLKDEVQYAQGSVVSKTLVDKKAGTLTLFAFDPGQGLSEHTAPFDAVIQVLDGEAEVTIQDKTLKVKTGELVIMPANKPHSIKALIKFKMLLTMIRE